MPVARSGRPLPNPRLLSSRVFAEHPRGGTSRLLTALDMQWGQLITHDMLFQVMDSTGKRLSICYPLRGTPL